MMLFRQGRKKLALFLSAGSLVCFGYLLGQQPVGTLAAQQVPQPNVPQAKSAELPPNADSKRVVAFIYGTKAITREEFGEYLIQRVGRERVELFVNKTIIESVAAQKGIEVNQAEIDAVIEEDCRVLSIQKSDFVASVLKRYGKTLFEWKEDVIKPRLMMTKMLRDSIKVGEEDLKKMFENRYGKKAKAQVIIWPKADGQYLKHAQRQYEDLRKGDNEFNAVARGQADPNLASREGHVEPIARYSPTGDNTIEDAVFALKPGEISRIIDTPVGAVVIKCLGFTDPVKGAEFDKVKADLMKEVIDQKITQEVPKLVEQLKAEAKPVYVLQPLKKGSSDLDREVKSEIESTGFKEEIKKIEEKK